MIAQSRTVNKNPSDFAQITQSDGIFMGFRGLMLICKKFYQCGTQKHPFFLNLPSCSSNNFFTSAP